MPFSWEMSVENGKIHECIRRADSGAVRSEAVVRYFNSFVFCITRAVLSNDVEAEACACRAWGVALQLVQNFEDARAFKVEIGRIAYREALESPRGSSSVRQPARRLPPLPRFEAGPPSPDEYDRWRRAHLLSLRKEVEGLSDEGREAFVLRTVGRLSAQDVAAILQVSEVNVRVRLHRVRKILSPHIREDIADIFTLDDARNERIVRNVTQAS